jgi:hypothetical protein
MAGLVLRTYKYRNLKGPSGRPVAFGLCEPAPWAGAGPVQRSERQLSMR